MSTRQELINSIAVKNNNISKPDIAEAVELIFDYIIDQLVEGNRVEIRGFGSFSIKSRAVSASSALPQVTAKGHKRVKTLYYRMSENLFGKIGNVN